MSTYTISTDKPTEPKYKITKWTIMVKESMESLLLP